MKEKYRKYLTEGERAGMRYALEIPREAMRGATGLQLGHGAGSSVDFKDYREYQPGDDLRSIDWNVFARSDKLTIKMYREEVNPHLDILIDCSDSMILPDTEKARSLLGLSGAMASAATNAKCSHAAWVIGDGFRPVANGADMPSFWDDIEFGSNRNPAEAFEIMPPRLRRNGIRILISDLLWIGDPLLVLRPLAEGASLLVVVQMLADADVNPALRGNMKLNDVESGISLDVFVDAVMEKRYKNALHNHQQNWHRACRQVGATMTTVIAEDISANWRFTALEKARILGAA